jgi:hypothetical protein
LKEEQIVFENGVLRKIVGPKRDEVIGCWRKLHKEFILFTKYYQDDLNKEEVLGRKCSLCGGDEKCIQNVGWKSHSEDLRTDGRILKSILEQKGLDGMDWIHLAQDRDTGRFL